MMVESINTITAQVVDMISADQVLPTKVLRLINSAFFGFTAVKGLVLTSSVFDIMVGEMLGLWMHSLGVSMTSGIIARWQGVKYPEEVQVAGLLHDIEKVVLKVEECGVL